MSCDLHSHSYFSDGSLSPEELIAGAERAGLTALALCDHNTVAGLPRFMAAGADSRVIPVPAAELTTDWEGVELHIVGLFLPESGYAAVSERLSEYLNRKRECSRATVENLRKRGYDISFEKLCRSSGAEDINRAHIALELVKKGYFETVSEVFGSVLAKGGGYYVEAARPDTMDTVELIASLGALPVAAHPLIDLDGDGLRRFLTAAKPHGLVGLETRYSGYSPEQTELAENAAREFDLLPSGGSDFHGRSKPDTALGTGRGELEVPDSYFYALLARSQSVHKSPNSTDFIARKL